MTKERYTEILEHLKTLIEGSVFQGHLYSVGGCERDVKLGNTIKDIDLVVDIPNGGIMLAEWLYNNGELLWAPVVYQNFGTAMFVLKGFPDEELEAVQTRKECYRDINSRDPETAFGTIYDDCTRRDFTVNAFYRNISTGESIDFNGNSEADLKERIIRTCGDPEIIFNEDPLRIMRMVRFATRLGFAVEKKTFECAKKYVDRLSIISRERIHDEFMKMCNEKSYTQAIDAMFMLWDIGAFKYIIPYLGEFGHQDVYYYMHGFIKFCEEMIGLTKEGMFAAMLFNDPDAEQELRDLKCTNDFIDEVLFLIKTNKEFENRLSKGLDTDFESGISLFREYAHICGNENRLRTMICCGGESALKYYFFYYDEEDGYFFDELNRTEKKFYKYELPVTGEDVMKELGIGPSKKVGEVLEKLWKFVFVNPDRSSREDIINYLKYVKTQGI